ncbi:hypothetical protein ACETU7_21655 [Rhodococcus sp. 3Y1]
MNATGDTYHGLRRRIQLGDVHAVHHGLLSTAGFRHLERYVREKQAALSSAEVDFSAVRWVQQWPRRGDLRVLLARWWARPSPIAAPIRSR